VKQEYAQHNQLEKVNQEIRKINLTQTAQSEKPNHFPFISGELLE
jgi:hypothetical protein